MDAPLALYRRYRPDTFADVIGQGHVTGPLSQALDHNRVNHAYLFSGPRGCGKTTSARIMARALNCDAGPTSVPCGECESCIELARGGSGSIDVIEIDAASHGGVDDARELRERAFFTPMKARYKIYIIDEAHMVTPQGFNALLKLVEEPPSHLRFIFATTEPDKVIGTIRSRTHHYPFRLVPPKLLGDYLLDLCGREGVTIEATVVPLVVRAGAGSVRDSLSVLDQLIGGSGSGGVTYALATTLLGYTPDSLLDEAVDALAADDGGTLFGVIEKVVDTGQDSRRFAEDLLHRLRDLVVMSAVPNAASRGLIELSEDQAERLSGQAARFGRAELTRAADIVSQGLTDMRGATAPRLLLEMMCARILLPGADQSVEGLGARLDRIERRLSVVAEPGAARADRRSAAPAVAERPAASAETSPGAIDRTTGAADTTAGAAERSSAAGKESPGVPRESAAAIKAPAGSSELAPGAAEGPASTSEPPGPEPAPAGRLGLVDVRQLWPGVLDRVKKVRRYAWILLSQNAHVKDVADNVITIGLTSAGARDSFTRSGADEILHQALIDELGVDWRVESIIDGPNDHLSAGTPRTDSSERPSQPPKLDPAQMPVPTAPNAGVEAAKGEIRPTRPGGGTPQAREDEIARRTTEAGDIGDDDDVIDDATLSSHELLSRELGAQVIEDIRHDPR
ncbi:MAG: DNA polymerase III subunit gamma and tau [Propionibacteriales bacterium]|nr:DNA polymerase III subunit gamma and tau [Propionibacteriales bacterium]